MRTTHEPDSISIEEQEETKTSEALTIDGTGADAINPGGNPGEGDGEDPLQQLRWWIKNGASPHVYQDVIAQAQAQLGNSAVVQFVQGLNTAGQRQSAQALAASGVSGQGQSLRYLDVIQQAFGHHDVRGVRRHTEPQTQTALATLEARAYSTAGHIAMSDHEDLHTETHEVVHALQQQARGPALQLKGGIGEEGDKYERQANMVADAVVQNKSAEGLLDDILGGPTQVIPRIPGREPLQMKPAGGHTNRKRPRPDNDESAFPDTRRGPGHENERRRLNDPSKQSTLNLPSLTSRHSSVPLSATPTAPRRSTRIRKKQQAQARRSVSPSPNMIVDTAIAPEEIKEWLLEQGFKQDESGQKKRHQYYYTYTLDNNVSLYLRVWHGRFAWDRRQFGDSQIFDVHNYRQYLAAESLGNLIDIDGDNSYTFVFSFKPLTRHQGYLAKEKPHVFLALAPVFLVSGQQGFVELNQLNAQLAGEQRISGKRILAFTHQFLTHLFSDFKVPHYRALLWDDAGQPLSTNKKEEKRKTLFRLLAQLAEEQPIYQKHFQAQPHTNKSSDPLPYQAMLGGEDKQEYMPVLPYRKKVVETLQRLTLTRLFQQEAQQRSQKHSSTQSLAVYTQTLLNHLSKQPTFKSQCEQLRQNHKWAGTIQDLAQLVYQAWRQVTPKDLPLLEEYIDLIFNATQKQHAVYLHTYVPCYAKPLEKLYYSSYLLKSAFAVDIPQGDFATVVRNLLSKQVAPPEKEKKPWRQQQPGIKRSKMEINEEEEKKDKDDNSFSPHLEKSRVHRWTGESYFQAELRSFLNLNVTMEKYLQTLEAIPGKIGEQHTLRNFLIDLQAGRISLGTDNFSQRVRAFLKLYKPVQGSHIVHEAAVSLTKARRLLGIRYVEKQKHQYLSVPGAGDCLFYAIQIALHGKIPMTARQLRAQCQQGIQRLQKDYVEKWDQSNPLVVKKLPEEEQAQIAQEEWVGSLLYNQIIHPEGRDRDTMYSKDAPQRYMNRIVEMVDDNQDRPVVQGELQYEAMLLSELLGLKIRTIELVEQKLSGGQNHSVTNQPFIFVDMLQYREGGKNIRRPYQTSDRPDITLVLVGQHFDVMLPPSVTLPKSLFQAAPSFISQGMSLSFSPSPIDNNDIEMVDIDNLQEQNDRTLALVLQSSQHISGPPLSQTPIVQHSSEPQLFEADPESILGNLQKYLKLRANKTAKELAEAIENLVSAQIKISERWQKQSDEIQQAILKKHENNSGYNSWSDYFDRKKYDLELKKLNEVKNDTRGNDEKQKYLARVTAENILEQYLKFQDISSFKNLFVDSETLEDIDKKSRSNNSYYAALKTPLSTLYNLFQGGYLDFVKITKRLSQFVLEYHAKVHGNLGYQWIEGNTSCFYASIVAGIKGYDQMFKGDFRTVRKLCSKHVSLLLEKKKNKQLTNKDKAVLSHVLNAVKTCLTSGMGEYNYLRMGVEKPVGKSMEDEQILQTYAKRIQVHKTSRELGAQNNIFGGTGVEGLLFLEHYQGKYALRIISVMGGALAELGLTDKVYQYYPNKIEPEGEDYDKNTTYQGQLITLLIEGTTRQHVSAALSTQQRETQQKGHENNVNSLSEEAPFKLAIQQSMQHQPPQRTTLQDMEMEEKEEKDILMHVPSIPQLPPMLNLNSEPLPSPPSVLMPSLRQPLTGQSSRGLHLVDKQQQYQKLKIEEVERLKTLEIEKEQLEQQHAQLIAQVIPQNPQQKVLLTQAWLEVAQQNQPKTLNNLFNWLKKRGSKIESQYQSLVSQRTGLLNQQTNQFIDIGMQLDPTYQKLLKPEERFSLLQILRQNPDVKRLTQEDVNTIQKTIQGFPRWSMFSLQQRKQWLQKQVKDYAKKRLTSLEQSGKNYINNQRQRQQTLQQQQQARPLPEKQQQLIQQQRLKMQYQQQYQGYQKLLQNLSNTPVTITIPNIDGMPGGMTLPNPYRQQLQQQLQIIIGQLNEKNQKINDINQQLNNISNIHQQQQRIKQALSQLNQLLPSFNTLTTQIQQCKQELDQLKEKIIAANKLYSMIQTETVSYLPAEERLLNQITELGKQRQQTQRNYVEQKDKLNKDIQQLKQQIQLQNIRQQLLPQTNVPIPPPTFVLPNRPVSNRLGDNNEEDNRSPGASSSSASHYYPDLIWPPIPTIPMASTQASSTVPIISPRPLPNYEPTYKKVVGGSLQKIVSYYLEFRKTYKSARNGLSYRQLDNVLKQVRDTFMKKHPKFGQYKVKDIAKFLYQSQGYLRTVPRAELAYLNTYRNAPNHHDIDDDLISLNTDLAKDGYGYPQPNDVPMRDRLRDDDLQSVMTSHSQLSRIVKDLPSIPKSKPKPKSKRSSKNRNPYDVENRDRSSNTDSDSGSPPYKAESNHSSNSNRSSPSEKSPPPKRQKRRKLPKRKKEVFKKPKPILKKRKKRIDRQITKETARCTKCLKVKNHDKFSIYKEMIGSIKNPKGLRTICKECNNRKRNERYKREKLSGKKVKTYSCPDCNKTFLDKNGMKRHINSIHLGIRHPCPHCDKTFSQIGNLKKHIKNIHAKEKYPCPQCKKTFSDKGSMTKHIKHIHLGIKHPCPHCDKTFSQKSNMTRHIKSMHLKEKYQCPHCKQVFSHKGNMNRHIKRMHNLKK